MGTRRCLGRFHQQEAQQGTALLADVPQPLLAGTGVLTRNHPHVRADLLTPLKALKEIDGHRALKYAALQQIGRIEKLKELEKKLQRPMRNGHKEIDALRKIAESIHEIEVGEQWLRGKGGKMPMTIPAGKRLK